MNGMYKLRKRPVMRRVGQHIGNRGQGNRARILLSLLCRLPRAWMRPAPSRPCAAICALVAAFGLLFPGIPGNTAMANVRIKDIASIEGIRENQLVGYGLVIGLQGTGDTLRNSPFTEQSLQSMLDSMGVNVRNQSLGSQNVAAVMVTAELPAFSRVGSRIDVTVSSLGDADSLAGGTLIATPLMGANGDVYAVAQGSVAVSGFLQSGEAETLVQGIPTVGRVPNGALIEQSIGDELEALPNLTLTLNNPDFGTVIMIVDEINSYTEIVYGQPVAQEIDYRAVSLARPPDISTARFIAEIETLTITPDTPARVVVDERTGTVVIGRNVQISTVAVTHGNLTVRISETPVVSQPGALSAGTTTEVPRTTITADQADASLAIVEGADLETLVRGLNRIGLKPTGIIAILQGVKTAGALQAELIVQ